MFKPNDQTTKEKTRGLLRVSMRLRDKGFEKTN